MISVSPPHSPNRGGSPEPNGRSSKSPEPEEPRASVRLTAGSLILLAAGTALSPITERVSKEEESNCSMACSSLGGVSPRMELRLSGMSTNFPIASLSPEGGNTPKQSFSILISDTCTSEAEKPTSFGTNGSKSGSRSGGSDNALKPRRTPRLERSQTLPLPDQTTRLWAIREIMGWNGNPDEDERKAKLKLLRSNGIQSHQIQRYELLNGDRDLDGIIAITQLGVTLRQLSQMDLLRPGLDTSTIAKILDFGIPLEKIKSVIDRGEDLKRFAGKCARGKTILIGDGGSVLARGVAGLNLNRGRLANGRPAGQRRARRPQCQTCEF